jgi:DNA-binding CsgD family transcriptional regulator
MEALEAWPLTGRAEELSILLGMLDGSDTEPGVVIAGRAGVGKTRLAREAVAQAEKLGWAVRWAVGTVAARSIPLGAFAEWATDLSDDPLQIVRGLIASITSSAQGKPVLVAVDDAHLLDDLSAFLLHQLVLRGAATVIATLRSGERAPDTVTALWKDGHFRRLELQPLSRSESDELLAAVLHGRVQDGCADQIWELTCGNALFLRQVVVQELDAGRLIAETGGWTWTGDMAVSPSLIELVDTQIGGVPEAVGEVIDLVALAEPLELDLLRRLAEPGTIENCERRGLITASTVAERGAVRLGHPLYGEVRLAQSGHLRLARLRGRIALAMAESGASGAPADPVRLGQLWLESDLPPDIGVMMAAAQGAYERIDIELTGRFAEAAVTAGAGPPAEVMLAHVLSLSTSPERAQEILDALAASELPDEVRSFVGQIRGANLLWPLAQPEASWAVIDDALAGASGVAQAEALAFRAIQLATAARPAEVLQIGARIDPGLLGKVPALMLGWAQTIALGDLGRPGEAGTLAEATLAAVDAHPEGAMQQPGVALCQIQAYILAGEIAQAREVADRRCRQWSDAPGVVLRVFTAAIYAMAALGAGDVTAALRRLRLATAPDVFDIKTGLEYYFLVINLQTVCYSGDSDAAAEALDQLERFRHPAYAFLDPPAQLAAAWVSATAGRLSEARRRAEQAAGRARANGQSAWEVCCRQALIQLGDTTQAPRLVELATQVQGPRATLAARWAQAVAKHDAPELATLSAEFEAIGDRIAAADTAAHAATAARRNGQRGTALTHATRANQLINQCGATTPATRAAATPLPLTSREREIAELLAAGLSTKEIAEALTLSARTVEGHIYRSCNKLGLADRTELAQLVPRLQPGDAPTT